MKKGILALMAGLTLLGSTVSPAPAEARNNWLGRLGWGLGGMAIGYGLGRASANYGYNDGYAYNNGYGYYTSNYGYYSSPRFYSSAYGNPYTYSRPVNLYSAPVNYGYGGTYWY